MNGRLRIPIVSEVQSKFVHSFLEGVNDLHSEIGGILLSFSGLYSDGDEIIIKFFVFIDQPLPIGLS